MLQMSLNGPWTMREKGTDVGYPAHVPTTMYKVLLDNGVIEDPFYGENDLLLTAMSDKAFTFDRFFLVSEELYAMAAVEIEFKGLDTLATIWLNGKLLAKTDNMHRTYRYQIKDYLFLGDNQLVIAFESPTAFIAREQSKDPLWGVSTTMDGYEHLRKAHHQFGWDWGPQLPDMGIWRDVTLYGYDGGCLEDTYIVQNHQSDLVTLTIETESKLLLDGLSLHHELTDRDGLVVAESHLDHVGLAEVTELKVSQPKLWWPNGYGEAYLYTLKTQLLDGETVIDQDQRHIGLRTMTIHKEKDQWGETFDYKINGVRIFAMGADYIPEHALITKPTRERTEQLIKDCAKANYNCLRVWGGGYYPNDDFFDLCDRYGLIVWQDFMFACGVYRLTKKFEANIKAEFIDNIKRIRHHACLGLWCGNNEMEWAFVEWDLPKDEGLKMDYLLMYEKLIPDVLAEYDPNTFYWPASPSSGGGFREPNSDNQGDVHYWQVFHGNEHYKKFRDHYFRFASEYGMQAFPDMKTINSYLPEGQRNLFSPVMENHNKCVDPLNGNVKILMNMALEFLMPPLFEDQIYLSQVFQGETIKCAVEHFRRNRGRCMGSTYWQVNDNYPVASWSSVDVYGRWKALHYMAKRFYSPVLISAYEEGTVGHIHISNDRLSKFEGKVQWQLRHVDGSLLDRGEERVEVDGLTAIHILDVTIDPYIGTFGDDRKIYLSYQLEEKGERLASETLLYVPHKYFAFDRCQLKAQTGMDENGCYVEVASDTFAKSVGLLTKSLDLVFEDNYFDVLPGEVHRVYVEDNRSKVTLTPELLLEDIDLKAVNSIAYEL